MALAAEVEVGLVLQNGAEVAHGHGDGVRRRMGACVGSASWLQPGLRR